MSDLYAPLSGKVVRVNAALRDWLAERGVATLRWEMPAMTAGKRLAVAPGSVPPTP